jgi:hypothetical protein
MNKLIYSGQSGQGQVTALDLKLRPNDNDYINNRKNNINMQSNDIKSLDNLLMTYTLDKKSHLLSGSMYDYNISPKYIEAYDILIEYIKQKIDEYYYEEQKKQLRYAQYIYKNLISKVHT